MFHSSTKALVLELLAAICLVKGKLLFFVYYLISHVCPKILTYRFLFT